MNVKKLVKTKTFWAGLLAVIGSIAGAATGEMDSGTAITTGINGLLAVLIRDGILKVGK